MHLPSITLEEHIFTQHMWDNLDPRMKVGLATRDPTAPGRLLEVGEGRLSNMDANSIETQVLSHIPRHADPEDIKRTNDEMHQIKEKYPGRFQAFAMLSINDPVSAAAELERSVKEYGFVGALFPNVLDDGTFYDTPRFYPLFEKAQELDVPLYFHPIFPSPDQVKSLFDGPYGKDIAIELGSWCYGWHATVGIHILRLFAAGIFEKFPKLKVIIGHMGETLPFMLERILIRTEKWPGQENRTRGLRQVWDENVWITTSGMFTLGPMSCLLKTTKIDHILYSVDYPLETNEEGMAFMESLARSGLVTEEEFHKIAYKNAKALLRI